MLLILIFPTTNRRRETDVKAKRLKVEKTIKEAAEGKTRQRVVRKRVQKRQKKVKAITIMPMTKSQTAMIILKQRKALHGLHSLLEKSIE